MSCPECFATKLGRVFFALVVGLFVCLNTLCFGQTTYDKLPVFIPAAPNAAELSKYGNLDVGLQTGSLNFKVPLFNLQGNNWTMPVDIQYSTTGIKVDQTASRVGMGWALNAGGVVTRSVNDRPDELNSRYPLPSTWSNFDQNTMTYLSAVTGPGFYDTEPDEFSFNFNGFSGKFVLNNNGEAVSIPHSNLKISFQPNGSGPSSVVIKTPDGSEYDFESIEYTTVDNLGNGIHLNVASQIATAWYLTKVILPNKEQVNFTYQNISYYYYTGIAQQITKSNDLYNIQANSCLPCNTIDDLHTYYRSINISGKRLSNISFRNLTAEFSYISRTDLGLPSGGQEPEKLLSSITLKSGLEVIKTHEFNYIYGTSLSYYGSVYSDFNHLKYRPYLDSYLVLGTNNESEGRYLFHYNDINGLPPRLSFSQDMNGYFNGKFNTSFIPKPKSASDQIIYSAALADRSTDLSSTIKGSLIKIDYPTGGLDSISYTLNDYLTSEIVVQRDAQTLGIPKTSSHPVVVTSPVFSTVSSQDITISGGALIMTGPDDTPAASVNLVRFEIVRQSDGVSVYTKVINSIQNPLSEILHGLSPNVDYFFRMTSLIDNIKCNATVAYNKGYTTYEVTKDAPGLRVSSLMTRNGASDPLTKKKYIYAGLSDLTRSTGKISSRVPELFNLSRYHLIGPCGGTIANHSDCQNYIAYSSSLVDLFPYSQSAIYYSKVIESLGDNFENGGVEHTYYVEPDQGSQALHSEFMRVFGMKLTNSGFRNGLEQQQLVFAKRNGLLVNLKKTVNSYKVDTTVHDVIPAYVITKNYDYPFSYNPVRFEEFDCFDIHKYKFYSAWVYKDSINVYDYDTNGNYVLNRTSFTYNNALHTQIGSSKNILSNGRVSETTYKYPHEMVSEGRDPSGVYQSMVSDHVIQPIVEEKKVVGNNQISFTKINYIQPFSGAYSPEYIQVQSSLASAIETRMRYLNHDEKNNVLSVSQELGTKICYVWAYGKSLPVAEIKNADYATVEAVLGSSTAINNFSNSMQPSDSTVNVFLQPLRTDTRLKNALITTYTYRPYVGMNTKMDEKGITTRYEYDNFQRLKAIKDQDGNIVKSYDYHYKP